MRLYVVYSLRAVMILDDEEAMMAVATKFRRDACLKSWRERCRDESLLMVRNELELSDLIISILTYKSLNVQKVPRRPASPSSDNRCFKFNDNDM